MGKSQIMRIRPWRTSSRFAGVARIFLAASTGISKSVRFSPNTARAIVKSGAAPGREILEFVLKEGRNRQVRRMCAHAELRVHRLVRVGIRDLCLGNLKPGQWRDLTQPEMEALRASTS